MKNRVSRKFWPYDEVTVTKDAALGTYFVQAPWLKVRFRVPVEDEGKIVSFIAKLSSGTLTSGDLDEVNWFFSPLAEYPFAYLLPKQDSELDDVKLSTRDIHLVQNEDLNYNTPHDLLSSLTGDTSEDSMISAFKNIRYHDQWSWDVEAALQFSSQGSGVDPASLFSVARRFHLLNDLESNQTAAMLELVRSFKDEPHRFREASALMLRQNHYITAQCESVLRAALPIARQAETDVLDFIQAESGHDRILEKALNALGFEASSLEVLSVTTVLMEIFRFSARRNLLAFAMIVDIFERTSYRSEDPVTSVLVAGGEEIAGKQIEVHRDINDAGGHENVALGFLDSMANVDDRYAIEALRLSELATLTIHQLSAETIKAFKRGSS